jgi:hypothetical protein
VAEIIQFDQIRRARRLFLLLLERVGAEHYLMGREQPKIDPSRLSDALELCCEWITRRTGEPVPACTRRVMQRQLRRLLIHRIAEQLVQVGH